MKARDVLLRLVAAGDAVDRLRHIQGRALKAAKTVEREVRVVDGASGRLTRAEAAARRASAAMTTMGGAGSVSLLRIGGVADRFASVAGRAGSSLSVAPLGGGGGGGGGAGPGLVGRVAGFRGAATKVAALAGSATYFSVSKGTDYEQLLGAIENRAESTEAAEGFKSWVGAGSGVGYSSQLQRATAAAQMAGAGAGGDVDLQTDFLEELERTIAISGASTGSGIRSLADASGVLDAFLSGNVQALNKIIPGYQLSGERIEALRDQYRATVPELRTATDRELDLYIGMREGLNAMRAANEGIDPAVSAAVSLRMSFEKLGLALGEGLVPWVEMAASALIRLAEIAEQYPRAAALVAYALLAAFLAASAVVMVSQGLGLVLGLKAAALAFGGLSLGVKAATAATWLLNAAMTANPIGLAVVGLAALAGLVAYVLLKTDTIGGLLARVRGVEGVEVGDPEVKVRVDFRGFALPGLKAAEGLLGRIWSGIDGIRDDLRGYFGGMGSGIVGHLQRATVAARGASESLSSIWDTFSGWADKVRGVVEGVPGAVGAILAGTFSSGLPGLPVASGGVPGVGGAGVEVEIEKEEEVEIVTLWRPRQGFDRMISDIYGGKTTFSHIEYSEMVEADQILLEPARVEKIPVTVARSLGYPVEEGTGDRSGLPGLPVASGGVPGVEGVVVGGGDRSGLPGLPVTPGGVPVVPGGEVEAVPVPSLDVGGTIEAGGLVEVHQDEEIPPAEVVRSGAGVVEMLADLIGASRPRSVGLPGAGVPEAVGAVEGIGGAGRVVTIKGPLVRMESIGCEADLQEMGARVRAALDDLLKEAAG